MPHLLKIYCLFVCLLAITCSCRESDLPEKRVLTQAQLQELVLELPEYDAYIQEVIKTIQSMVLKATSLKEEEKTWIKEVHKSYTRLDDFLQHSPAGSLHTYRTYTTIDLLKGNAKSREHFLRLLSALQSRARYQPEDLAQILIPPSDTTLFQGFFSTCSDICSQNASTQQVEAYSYCIQVDTDAPENCVQKAELTFLYTLRGCLVDCPIK